MLQFWSNVYTAEGEGERLWFLGDLGLDLSRYRGSFPHDYLLLDDYLLLSFPMTTSSWMTTSWIPRAGSSGML